MWRELRGALLLGAALSTADCRSAQHDPTGGETHFLERCADSDSCGSGLSCICEVCSLPCADAAACGEFPSAACVVPSQVGSCSPSSGYCDVGCSTHADCSALSDLHRCVGGACRLNGAGAECTPVEASADQVLIIGDSFFAAGHRITAFLEELARQSGAIGAGERYRDHSSLLDNTLALLGNGIEQQYAAARAESDVKVVIMNGGGADVLAGSCETPSPDCPLLVDAVEAARALLARMAEEGVAAVVYAFYPDHPDPPLNEKVDALRPLMASACEESPVPCHWVDLRTSFAGHEAEYLEADGISPTPEGAEASAGAIWTTLQEHCIAQ